MDRPTDRQGFLHKKQPPERYVCMERCINNTGDKTNAVQMCLRSWTWIDTVPCHENYQQRLS